MWNSYRICGIHVEYVESIQNMWNPEVFTLPHLFLLESSWNPTIPGRNTRNPGGMTRNFLPANLHSNPQFLVLPSPGGIHLESWQISSPTRIPGHLGGIVPPGILLESYHSW